MYAGRQALRHAVPGHPIDAAQHAGCFGGGGRLGPPVTTVGARIRPQFAVAVDAENGTLTLVVARGLIDLETGQLKEPVAAHAEAEGRPA